MRYPEEKKNLFTLITGDEAKSGMHAAELSNHLWTQVVDINRSSALPILKLATDLYFKMGNPTGNQDFYSLAFESMILTYSTGNDVLFASACEDFLAELGNENAYDDPTSERKLKVVVPTELPEAYMVRKRA